MLLLRKAFAALPPGGAFVAIDNLIDDERRQGTLQLGMSLNMLIEFGEIGGCVLVLYSKLQFVLPSQAKRTPLTTLLRSFGRGRSRCVAWDGRGD